MKPIRVSDLAERDLDEIWLQIAERAGSLQRADRVVEAISPALVLLARNPRAGWAAMRSIPGCGDFRPVST